MRSKLARALVISIPLALGACGGAAAPGSGTGGSAPVLGGAGGGGGGTGGTAGSTINLGSTGTPVQLALSQEQKTELDRLSTLVAANEGLGTNELLDRHRVPFATALGYDPSKAVNLPLIQGSRLALDDAELGRLARDGFVVSPRRQFPGFLYGYESIYGEDLPVYVSVDSILHALHSSYDEILKAVELESLAPELEALLASMRTRLASAATPPSAEARADADVLVSVAASLLADKYVAPAMASNAKQVETLFAECKEANGASEVTLFGIKRDYDFSQLKPRGHYLGIPALERYFRAMMWLGRTELPIMHVDRKGQARFVRRQLDAALALRAAMDDAAYGRWHKIDQAIRAFVGEPDSMSPLDVDGLLKAVGASDVAATTSIPDQTIASAIVTGGFGRQAIASQIVITPPRDGTLPLNASFLFLGQRYVFDSHVFSNVVYDRHNPEDRTIPRRMMPDPLDVAYAALHNDHAASLLAPALDRYRYAGALENMRALGDEHPPAFWNANLYNHWLSALRALSPGADVGNAASGLPAVARTEAWGRRVLNAQLASWAELRRDTILYAKQSYTSGIACEFPDAYVDPYPEAFARIGAFANAGVKVADTVIGSATPNGLGAMVKTYFQHLADVARILREMAENQRTGVPHTAAHMAFINQTVKIQLVCGGVFAEGWYPKLFFNVQKATEYDPTIADVHTQPTDEAGSPVGRVLHVATGNPRYLVVTVETCQGVRAYAGLVSAYHEVVTEDYKRLDDKQWKESLTKAPPADVPWMGTLLGK